MGAQRQLSSCRKASAARPLDSILLDTRNEVVYFDGNERITSADEMQMILKEGLLSIHISVSSAMVISRTSMRS